MKNVFLSFSLIFLCPYLAFTQLDTTRMLEYRYNPDAGEWLVDRELVQRFSGDVMTEKSIKTYDYVEGEHALVHHQRAVYDESGMPQLEFSLTEPVGGSANFYKEYFYLDNQLDEIFWYNHPFSSEAFQLSQRIKHHYNSNNLLETKAFETHYGNNMPRIYRQINYIYDDNACLLEESDEKNGSHQKITYIRDHDCEEMGRIYSFRSIDTVDYIPRDKITHHEFFEGEHLWQVDSVYRWQQVDGVPDWVFLHANQKEFDANLNKVREIKYYSNFDYEEWVWTYHASGEILTVHRTSSISETFLSHTNNELTFDENGYLIEKYQTRSGVNGIFGTDIFYYENYCNGNPKYIIKETPNLLIKQQRFYFEYREADDCETPSNEFPINIYPNPGDGKITIETDALQENSSHVRVYSTIGQLVFEKFVPNQAFGVELDLSHLNRGNYLVTVIGNNHYAAEKIVIRSN